MFLERLRVGFYISPAGSTLQKVDLMQKAALLNAKILHKVPSKRRTSTCSSEEAASCSKYFVPKDRFFSL